MRRLMAEAVASAASLQSPLLRAIRPLTRVPRVPISARTMEIGANIRPEKTRPTDKLPKASRTLSLHTLPRKGPHMEARL